jgi:hypothetical protein
VGCKLSWAYIETKNKFVAKPAHEADTGRLVQRTQELKRALNRRSLFGLGM